MLLCASLPVTRVSLTFGARLSSKNEAPLIGGGKERSVPSLVYSGSQHFFSISGKFFWATDSSLQSSGCKNLNHWAVHGVRNRTISSCLAQLINTHVKRVKLVRIGARCPPWKMSCSKKFLNKSFSPHSSLHYPLSPLQETSIMLHFCTLLYNLPLILYDQSHILFRRLKVCLQKNKNNQ